MITIKNTQRTVPMDRAFIIETAQKILDTVHYADFDLGIWITNNKTIRTYNRNFRHKDKATDILSFPYHPTLIAGKRIRVKHEEDRNVGDLIISAEYVVKEAEKYKVSLEDRMRVLLVHGVCHLLGYDHIEDHDYRRMRAKEAYILKKLR